MRLEGKLKKWNAERGFGFIAVTGAADVFVHIGAFPRDGRVPAVGDVYWFDIGSDARGRPCAVRLSRTPEPLPLSTGAAATQTPVQTLTLQPIARPARRTSATPVIERRPRHDPQPRRRSSRLPVVLLLVAIVAGAGLWQRRSPAPAAPEPVDDIPPTREMPMPERAAAPAASYRCDGRTLCPQMTSCAEATWFLRNCPGVKMDGNHDGVPCEIQWCR